MRSLLDSRLRNAEGLAPMFRVEPTEMNVIGGYFSRGLEIYTPNLHHSKISPTFTISLVKPVSLIPVLITLFTVCVDYAATSVKNPISFLEVEHDVLSLYCFFINCRLSLFLDSLRCQSLLIHDRLKPKY